MEASNQTLSAFEVSASERAVFLEVKRIELADVEMCDVIGQGSFGRVRKAKWKYPY